MVGRGARGQRSIRARRAAFVERDGRPGGGLNAADFAVGAFAPHLRLWLVLATVGQLRAFFVQPFWPTCGSILAHLDMLLISIYVRIEVGTLVGWDAARAPGTENPEKSINLQCRCGGRF